MGRRDPVVYGPSSSRVSSSEIFFGFFCFFLPFLRMIDGSKGPSSRGPPSGRAPPPEILMTFFAFCFRFLYLYCVFFCSVCSLSRECMNAVVSYAYGVSFVLPLN